MKLFVMLLPSQIIKLVFDKTISDLLICHLPYRIVLRVISLQVVYFLIREFVLTTTGWLNDDAHEDNTQGGQTSKASPAINMILI